MPVDMDEVGKEVAAMMARLAQYIQPLYPHHAEALFGEVVDTVLTNERWTRTASLLSSMSAIPGVYLQGAEHDLRNMALSSVPVAQKMARATYGGIGADEAAELARWLAADISDRMSS